MDADLETARRTVNGAGLSSRLRPAFLLLRRDRPGGEHHHVQRRGGLGPKAREGGGLGANRSLVGGVGAGHRGRHDVEVHRAGRGQRGLEGGAQRGVQGGGGAPGGQQRRVDDEVGAGAHAQVVPQDGPGHVGVALDGRLVRPPRGGGGGGGGGRGEGGAQGDRGRGRGVHGGLGG